MNFLQTYDFAQNLYEPLKLSKFVMEHQLEANTSKCETLKFSKPNYVTNLLSINSYKFCTKFDFHKFVQKLHELCAMVNMNDICTYSISYIYKQMKHFF